jgi:hypothetical protein
MQKWVILDLTQSRQGSYFPQGRASDFGFRPSFGLRSFGLRISFRGDARMVLILIVNAAIGLAVR